jgi:hypothetical protein
MAPLPIVEHLHVLEDRAPCLGASVVALPVDQFGMDARASIGVAAGGLDGGDLARQLRQVTIVRACQNHGVDWQAVDGSWRRVDMGHELIERIANDGTFVR